MNNSVLREICFLKWGQTQADTSPQKFSAHITWELAGFTATLH